MSALYKRRVVSAIVKQLQLQKSDVQTLERKLRRVIKVKPYQQNAEPAAYMALNKGKLKSILADQSYDSNTLGDRFKIQETAQDILIQIDEKQFFQEILKSVMSGGPNYGYTDDCEPRQTVCVEFSSPNIAKPFHIGHLRSTIIGNIISNLYEASGHDVKRMNFLGDWGTQFGLLTLGLQKYGRVEKLAKDPLLELFKVYVRINSDVNEEKGKGPDISSQTYQNGLALFAKLDEGDPELLSIWSNLRDMSMAELEKMYQRLGVRFTDYIPESDYRTKTGEVLMTLKNKNLLKTTKDGVGYVEINQGKQPRRATVVKSDGTSVYLTRDIAAALEREKTFTCHRMHYVVEMGQREHFSNLVYILDKLGVAWASVPINDIHIRFGRVRGMSTRKGEVVFLRNLLDEAKDRVITSMSARDSTRVSQNLEEVADRLAVSSIILQDIKSDRAKDYTFSWERMLNFKADSGVFVQYCFARLHSMMENCGVEIAEEVDVSPLFDSDGLVRLTIHLARYPDVYQQSLTSVEPHHIVQYMFTLCHLINTAYAQCPVKGQANDIAQARLLLFASSKQVLANCLNILGIVPLPQI